MGFGCFHGAPSGARKFGKEDVRNDKKSNESISDETVVGIVGRVHAREHDGHGRICSRG